MKSSTKIAAGVLVIAAALFVMFKITGNVSAEPSIYDSFAKCTSDSGAVMYGAYWCPHCENQKEIFGSSFKYVNYIECDPRGNNAKPELCEQAEIQGYPTWIFSNGEKRSGEMPLRTLASLTGCTLPES